MDNKKNLAELEADFFRNIQGDQELQQILQSFAHEQIQHHPQTFHSHAFGEGTYTNEQIQEAHRNISLTDGHFEAMVNHFVQSLNAHGYSEEDKEKALQMLLQYKDVVLGS